MSVTGLPFISAVLVLFVGVACMDNLQVAYQWKKLDFAYPSEPDRQNAIDAKEFVPEHNIPVGLEVYGDRLFITVPRWKSGVPASLNYIKLSDNTTQSPKLIPYPAWSSHKLPPLGGDAPEIVSPFRVRADACNRLWVLDTGVADILSDNPRVLAPTQLLVYDLHNDALMRRYTVPADQIKHDSFFANIAVEDSDCDDTYAYAADLGAPGLVVYSWRSQSSWRIKHHYFHSDPLAGNYTVNGINFQWTDGLFGLALSAPKEDGFSTLYFHPMSSTNEFSVSTEFLRSAEIAEKNFHEFKLLGSRGPNAQSSVAFLDQKTGVLFYALVNLNAVACWKTNNTAYTIQSQGRVFMSNVSMVFPNDVKVDANSNLWILSDRLPAFMYSELNYDDVNFRVLTASVMEATAHTACDTKPKAIPELIDKIQSIIKPIIKGQKSSGVVPRFEFSLAALSVLLLALFAA